MEEIKKLSELEEKQLHQSISVFVEGFYNVFSTISKDKEKLHKLFLNSFDYDMTYAFLQDGEAVGFLGLADYKKRPLKVNKKIFMEIIGGLAGKLSYMGVSTALEKLNTVNPQDIYIDYIATDPNHRSKGIGAKLLNYVSDTLGYKNIELEVFSKNPRAKQFYEREGFKVINEKKDFMMKLQGFGNRIILRKEI